MSRPSQRQRRYPQMLALLKNPARMSRFAFDRASSPKISVGRPSFTEMAKEVLVGHNAAGQSQIRVTLRDTFFEGTQLHLTLEQGRLMATLWPTNRATYLALSEKMEALRGQLLSRGIAVAALVLKQP